MNADDLRDLLIANDLITEATSPNASHQYVLDCPECGKKRKWFISASEDEKCGLFKCQVCEYSGSGRDLEARFKPVDPLQAIYRDFHEYAVRRLIKTPAALKHLHDRDLNEDDVAAYGLGYTDEGYVKHLKSLGYSADDLKAAGLLNPDGKPLFYDSLIFPYKNGSEYETFKGRNLDPSAKMRFVALSGRKPGLYQKQNLYKSGRVFFTEGESKTLYLIVNGYNAVGLSGAGNFGQFIPTLNAVPDLWIILDSDKVNEKGKQPGQDAAKKLAAQLDHCHLVTLPLGDEDKVGVDDYLKCHSDEEFEALLLRADYYVKGEKQKPRALSVIVEQWKEKAKSLDRPLGFDIGFPRLNEMLGGIVPGTLGYIIGAPSNGKTSLLRAMTLNVYRLNPSLQITCHTNDDSLQTTLAHFVAMIGELNAKDSRQPALSYANDRFLMKRWEEATNELASMGDRLEILDRSYRFSLEALYEETQRWRDANQTAERVIMVDGFSKIHSKAADLHPGDDRKQVAVKSDQLKRIAQEANVGIFSTIEPPKLYGKRPQAWDQAHSAQAAFDADIVIGSFIESENRGLDRTDLKMLIEYDDNVSEWASVCEQSVLKNKISGDTGLNLFIMHKGTSQIEELTGADFEAMKRKVLASEANQKKYGEK